MIDTEMPVRLSSPVLIGRVAEMAALQSALERAEAGAPVVALVGGEAGIGKSRIVAEVADRARQRERRRGSELGCGCGGDDEGREHEDHPPHALNVRPD